MSQPPTDPTKKKNPTAAYGAYGVVHVVSLPLAIWIACRLSAPANCNVWYIFLAVLFSPMFALIGACIMGSNGTPFLTTKHLQFFRINQD